MELQETYIRSTGCGKEGLCQEQELSQGAVRREGAWAPDTPAVEFDPLEEAKLAEAQRNPVLKGENFWDIWYFLNQCHIIPRA